MFNINQRLSVCTIGYLLLQLVIQTNVIEKTSMKKIPIWEKLTWGIGYNHVLEAGSTLRCLNNKLI